jgi:hypothetical protein
MLLQSEGVSGDGIHAKNHKSCLYDTIVGLDKGYFWLYLIVYNRLSNFSYSAAVAITGESVMIPEI